MVNFLTESEKDLAIERVMDEINKKYGQGSIVKGANARGLKINRLKTGSLALDIATGGGWAMGKLNEVYGAYAGGKSYISQLTVAQTQKDYPEAMVAWIDFEGAFDEDWAQKIGINTEKLVIASPEYMEDGLQIASTLIQSREVILLVVDSLAAACPRKEYDGEMDDFTVGLRARLGNKFVRKSKPHVNLLSDEVDLGETTLLLINQTYKNIGGYGDIDITPGGEQVKFGAMVRVKIRRGETVNADDGSIIMQESKFKVEKNKTYPPHKTGSFWFSVQDNPKGKRGEIWRAGEVITYGVLTGVIKKSGAWYYIPEDFGAEKFQGEAKLTDWILENPELYPRLEEIILKEIERIK